MKTNEKLRNIPAIWRVFRWVLLCIAVFAFTGFLIVPIVSKYLLIKNLSETLHREVLIDDIDVNPFALSVHIYKALIKGRDNSSTLLSFDELHTNLQISSAFKKGLILREITIEKPYMNVIRNEDGSYNISDLLEGDEKEEKEGPSQPLRFSINNIRILNGSIDFWDGPKHTGHKAQDITITIPMISNFPYFVDTFVQLLFKATVNDTPVLLEGRTKPFHDSLETAFDLDIKEIDIPHYLAYVPLKMNFRLLSGTIDGKNRISFTQYKDRPSTLTFSGDISLTNLRALHKDNSPLITLPSLDVTMVPSELISGHIHLSSLMIQSPEIHVKRDKAGELNVLSLIGGNEGKTPDDQNKQDTTALTIEADVASVADGKLIYSDDSNEEAFETVIENIDVNIDHFSTLRDKKSSVDLSLQTEAGETMKLSGDFSVTPLGSEGQLELQQIVPQKYAPYYDEHLAFYVRDGALDIFTKYTFSMTDDNPDIKTSEMQVTLRTVKLRRKDEKEDFLRIPIYTLEKGEIDFAKKQVTIGEASTKKGEIVVRRYKDGTMNVQPQLPKLAEKIEEAAEEKEAPPWIVDIKKIAYDDYTIKMEDLVPADPVHLSAEQIRLKAENISTRKNSKGSLSYSFKLNKKGAVSGKGSIGINPVAEDVTLSLKDIDIVPLQPYIADKIKIMITEGSFSADGTLSYITSEERGLTASYKGTVSLSKFSSVDKTNTEDFLKWDSIYLTGMDFGYNPFYLNIDEVALSDFYTRLVINPDGTLNVQEVMEHKGAEAESLAKDEGPEAGALTKEGPSEKKIKIDTVTLQGGTINFSDRHIDPNYSANLLEIGGRISGMSSAEGSMADVNLRGKLENYAPLEITGNINPLRDNLFVDLAIDFNDIDLSPLTPYSSRYVGYTIQKGKLSLALKYVIKEKKLDSENKVFLDQFTLGDKVDSPDATKLPVGLAIALLKNSSGEIHLDLPVSGNIDDPEFRPGSVIIKMLGNILIKAASSPFALLGAIVGGGEELSYIDFDYGSFDIPAQEKTKLNSLIKALKERPSLNLEIVGHVDREKDGEGLRQYRFQKKLKARKLKDIVMSGKDAVPVDDIVIEPGEYENYLKKAYKQETFPKPRTALGFTKKLPVPEMEKLMLTHIDINDDDLRQLASQRALKVKDYLLKSGEIDQNRIFLTEPASLQPEENEKLKNSRVDFKLK